MPDRRRLSRRPDHPPAQLGIALTAISIGVMLWLARAKRDTGEALGSRALIADSHQTYACWHLSVTTLAGLAQCCALGLPIDLRHPSSPQVDPS